MRLLALQPADARPALQAFDLAPIATVVTELPRWGPVGRRRGSMGRSVGERRGSEKSTELGGIERRRNGAFDGEERIVFEC
jgi:hypothetical protein